MLGLGEHAPFILGSYAMVVAVLAGLIGWLYWNGLRAQSQLSALEKAGVTRRQSRQGDSS